jgi:signal transduction histidine kinase
MRLSIKTKQVAGVTLLVGIVVLLLSGWYLSRVAKVMLEQIKARADVMVASVVERITDIVQAGDDPLAAIQGDSGLQSILQSISAARGVSSISIVDTRGVIIADPDPDPQRIGIALPTIGLPALADLLKQGTIPQIQAIRAKFGRNYAVREPLNLNGADIGAIHLGVSTLLLQADFEKTFEQTLLTAAGTIAVSMLLAMLMAQVVLRPIHVIRSGLARLGRGELDVQVDLPPDSTLGDLGESFKAVTARLAADRTERAEQRALESVVDRLEDAVALVGTDATLLFANPAMARTLGADRGAMANLLPSSHPYRVAVESSLQTLKPTPPRVVEIPAGGERLVLTEVVADAGGQPIGVLIVARNLAYLAEVESTLGYARKFEALSKITGGVGHEIRNPLNAATIHLELLRIRLADVPEALEHLQVISTQIRRMNEVVQGLIKFNRVDALELQPVALAPLMEDILPVVLAEAEKNRVEVRVDVPRDLPPANGDADLLRQAFLNLALNACQAMPRGGRLRIAARIAEGRLEVRFEDTGVGISPADLERIFDLYFTTKEHGSGIGLSLVYRTVQLHDGEIEVQSTPGSGTTFRVLLRTAKAAAPVVLQKA